MTTFAPLQYFDGYLPLEDHGLIGDGNTAALVGRDGAIPWLCVPRFDSPPLFCGLLDAAHGGALIVAPEELVEARQFYEPDSAVLVTEMRSHTGLVRLTDALTLRAGADLTEDVAAGRCELLRSVEVLEGQVQLRIEIEPRGGAVAEPRSGGLMLRCPAQPQLELHLSSTIPLATLQTKLSLKAGDRFHLSLRWGCGVSRHHPRAPEQLFQSTLDAWRRWMKIVSYDGPQAALVRRSAITLKLLDHFAGGAIVAAPTSSLPEIIGGERNWDYRYAWIRDTAFSVYALHRIGCSNEAAGFLAWALDAAERAGRPRVLYDLDGNLPIRSRSTLGAAALDASLLTLPLRRVVPANHPRMIATTQAIREKLGAGNGLLYRYLLHESPDGLSGREGAFVICSFWLVDNLAYQGRLDEAVDLYDSLCRRANPLGLMPEQIDPGSGAFLGNFPQAFSHVGLISSGVNLARFSGS